MKKNKITYPQYRKYAHGKTYFKILSPMEFEEVQILGKQIARHHFTAKILPDHRYIYDLTFDYDKYWLVITREEYEEKIK